MAINEQAEKTAAYHGRNYRGGRDRVKKISQRVELQYENDEVRVPVYGAFARVAEVLVKEARRIDSLPLDEVQRRFFTQYLREFTSGIMQSIEAIYTPIDAVEAAIRADEGVSTSMRDRNTDEKGLDDFAKFFDPSVKLT